MVDTAYDTDDEPTLAALNSLLTDFSQALDFDPAVRVAVLRAIHDKIGHYLDHLATLDEEPEA